MRWYDYIHERANIIIGVLTGVCLAFAQAYASSEFYQDEIPLRISVTAGTNLQLTTTRRIDRPGVFYRINKGALLTGEWSTIATYSGDGGQVTVLDQAFKLSIFPLDDSFETLTFSRQITISPAEYYWLMYWGDHTVASGQTGEWSEIHWSQGVPVSAMTAELADSSLVSISTPQAEARRLFIGNTPAGSTLTIDGGRLTLSGQGIVGGSSNGSGALTVNSGFFQVNAANNATQRFEVGTCTPAENVTDLYSRAVFAGGMSVLADIRFNLNGYRTSELELTGSGGFVFGKSLWGNELTKPWIYGTLAFRFDEHGISPLALDDILNLGTNSNHFDLVIDGSRYAGDPCSFTLVSATGVTGAWASTSITGFNTDYDTQILQTNNETVLKLTAPLGYYTDTHDATYVWLSSRDNGKQLYHVAESGTVSYTAGLAHGDSRAHWSIQSSSRSNYYWIVNRNSGKNLYYKEPAGSQAVVSVLIDFGTDSTYRGASVPSPDHQGNYWNGVGMPNVTDMLDIHGVPAGIDLVFTSGYGTDSYNGPAGPGNPPDPANVQINAGALGILAVTNAVYDYFAGSNLTFEIRNVQSGSRYTLTFFGSHKYNTDNVTIYAVTDSGGGVITSAPLTVGVDAAHNQDTVAEIRDIVPGTDNTIYIRIGGSGGNLGYINAMQIEETGMIGGLRMGSLQETDPGYQWKLHGNPGFFRLENGETTNIYCSVGTAPAGTATGVPLDATDTGQQWELELVPRGAQLPWTSYDEGRFTAIGHGARVLPPTYDRLVSQSEAQKRSAILLEQEGAYVEWKLMEQANAMVVRYSIEDIPGGGGTNGSVTLEVRDTGGSVVETQKLPVSSEQAWVYFNANMQESNDPGFGRPAKRFDAVRVKTATTLQPGYTVRLHRSTGEPKIWIDVLETEEIDAPIVADPAQYLNVTDYGAVANDGGDDLSAFQACIVAAEAGAKGVYIPAGVFELSNRIDGGGITIQGAGMWHTELHFTAAEGGVNKIGFGSTAGNTTVRDLYMRTRSTTREGGGHALNQFWGTDSLIENVWAEQFAVGAWIADYAPPYEVTDGLRVRNCRFRNMFADGVNFARGTRNSIVENCHFRGTGDDSMATWSSTTDLPMCISNIFRYNTVECTYRAAGVGIFGGEGHLVHHNMVNDVVSGPGMRFDTTFALNGYEFSGNGMMQVYKNTLRRTGTLSGYVPYETYGAISLITTYGDVRNIVFRDILIDDVMNNGVYVYHRTWGSGGTFTNILFDTVNMVRVPTGTWVRSTAIGEMEYRDVNVTLDPVRGVTVMQNDSSQFTIW